VIPQIPDRQKAIAGMGDSPLKEMVEGIERLNQAGATRIVIACNTAHYWYDELAAASKAPIIHIADSVCNHLPEGLKKVGILATKGTIDTQMYQSKFEKLGIPFELSNQEELNDFFTPACYAVKQNQIYQGGYLFEKAAQGLIDRGASHILMACTEVPLGLDVIGSSLLEISIDPAKSLALECIKYWHSAA